jgi:hypothetical protein
VDRPAILFQPGADSDDAEGACRTENRASPSSSRPPALFWFRWAALATVVTGLVVAHLNGYLHAALMLQPGAQLIGVGMWLALVMAFNVWFRDLAQPEARSGHRARRRCGEGENPPRPR